jgi:NAD-dependent oxidoreductase involved in siderophore biosynthesis
MFDELRKKKVEADLAKAMAEMDAIKAEEARIQKEKDDKLRTRKRIESQYNLNCQKFHAHRPAGDRFIAFLMNAVASSDPASLSVEVQKLYGVVEIMDALSKMGKSPAKKPRFDAENNLLTD